jgi:hypothetical protein
MGWWGSLVLGRSERPIAELGALGEYGETLELRAELGGGWQVWAHDGAELADTVERWLPELAGACRSPVLTAFVLDSDCADVRGFGPDSGWWSACLDRPSMDGYLSEDGLEVDDSFPDSREAARAAANWSADAGQAADESALVRVFEAEAEPFAEDLFDDLLAALGLPGRMRRPITDPEVLAKRDEALARARAARARTIRGG